MEARKGWSHRFHQTRLANIFRDIKQEVVLTLLFRLLSATSRRGAGQQGGLGEKDGGWCNFNFRPLQLKGFTVFGFQIRLQNILKVVFEKMKCRVKSSKTSSSREETFVILFSGNMLRNLVKLFCQTSRTIFDEVKQRLG